jgi:hypothetical protein
VNGGNSGNPFMVFTCPTPPTTEEPIIACTDWCPYFEGPSSLYVLSGSSPASSFTKVILFTNEFIQQPINE